MKVPLWLTGLCLASVLATAPGCSSGGPNPKVEAKRLDNGLKASSIYNKVQGEYNQLAPADKATFDDIAGGDAAGKKMWAMMKAARTPRDPNAPSTGPR